MRITRIADPRAVGVARKAGGKESAFGAITTPHQPTESPNTLRSLATARILEVLSEGVVYGPVFDSTIWQAVFLDGTPLADAAGNFNFQIKEGNFRYGYPSQDPIPGYPIAESEQNVGVECQPFVPVVRSLSLPCSSVRWTLTVAALYTQESTGDVVEASVSYAFDFSVDGGPWTNAWTERISGKTMSPYQRSVRFQLPPATSSIDVRVIRLDPAPPSGTANTLSWTTYTEIVDGQLAYDDTAVVSITIDAEEFSTIPQRAYLLRGVMVQLPITYDGLTHGDSGNWDGTFYTQWTNNPAWLLYAMLTNERWGLGRLLDVAIVDKWSFYAAQLYNDQPVDDGKGGIEPRFTCNTVLNTRQDAFSVLQAIASNMLGQLYYAGGTISLVQDRPLTDPTRLFGPADVEAGLFDYMSADVRSRFTAAAITWNDPGDAYKPAVELVQDPQLVAEQGYRETQQTYFGCTSRAQAQRYGRWLLYTSQYETEVVSFTTGLENADLRPGDLILISDPSRVGARIAGRVMAQTTDTLTLDSTGDAIGTSGWTLYVTVGSAADAGGRPSVIELDVVEVQAGNVVRVAGKTVDVPVGSMWLARASGLVEPTPWRVAAVQDKGQSQYGITATEYHVEKFTYVDTGVFIPPPPFSLIPTGPLQPPTHIHYVEYIYLDGSGVPQFGVVLSWSAAADPRVTRYQVEMSGPGGDYRKYTHVAGVTLEVPAMRQGEWHVSVRGFDNIGRRSKSNGRTFIPKGLSALPKPPKAIYLAPQGDTLTVSWVATGEIDVMFYWVKFSPKTDGTAKWEWATTSIARVARDITQVTTPARPGTYFVKTLDALGQESKTAANAILLSQKQERLLVLDDEEQGGTLVRAFDWMTATQPAGATLTRASTAWVTNSSGVLTSAANDVARFPYTPAATPLLRGAHNEPVAINQIRNATGSGAVVGTPGTVPTNWTVTTTADSVTRNITAANVVEDGIAYTEIRFFGTPTATSAKTIRMEASTQIAAVVGQAWTTSAFVSLAPGSSLSGVSLITLATEMHDSGGALLAGTSNLTIVPVVGSLRSQRFDVTHTLPTAGTAFVQPRIAIAYANGVAIDVTLRIGLPQCVQSASPSSPIVTTGSAAVTRAAETMSLAVPNGIYDIATTRESGLTNLTDVAVAAGVYVVPTSVSPLQHVDVRAAAWPGDKGPNWIESGGELWMAPPTAPETIPVDVILGDRGTLNNQEPTRAGVYTFAAPFDLGMVSSLVALTAYVESYGRYASAVMSSWVPLSVAKPLSRGDSDQWDAFIEVAISQDAVTYGPWTRLTRSVVTGRAFKARLVGVLYDLETTMRLQRAAITVELGSRTVTGEDAAIDGTGHLAVVYATPFWKAPNVLISPRSGLSAGGAMVLTASDRFGFTVEHRTSGGVAVAGGSIDWRAAGYGGNS